MDGNTDSSVSFFCACSYFWLFEMQKLYLVEHIGVVTTSPLTAARLEWERFLQLNFESSLMFHTPC